MGAPGPSQSWQGNGNQPALGLLFGSREIHPAVGGMGWQDLALESLLAAQARVARQTVFCSRDSMLQAL